MGKTGMIIETSGKTTITKYFVSQIIYLYNKIIKNPKNPTSLKQKLMFQLVHQKNIFLHHMYMLFATTGFSSFTWTKTYGIILRKS